MNRNIVTKVFVALGVIAGLAGALDAARVDEIAAWLPERPAAAGARIGDRAAWDRLAALPSAAGRIRAAEKALAAPIPELTDEMFLDYSRTGSRVRFEKAYKERTTTLVDLLLGECLENRGRFIPGIVARVKAIASERSWVVPAHDGRLRSFNGAPHVDLGCANRAVKFAFVYDWLRDVLPQDVRALMLAECDRRAFQPFLATCRNPDAEMRRTSHRWYEGSNNWNAVCNSGVVRAALAMVEDRRLRAEFVASAEHTVPFYLRGFTPDGYCSEGIGYWNYGFSRHLYLGLAVRAATGGKVDLLADPRHRATVEYAYGYRLEGWKSPRIADGVGNPGSLVLALARQLFPEIGCRRSVHVDLLEGDVDAISLRAFGQEPPPTYSDGRDELPVRTWFPDAQVLISRGSWPSRNANLSVAVKGGHNAEFHNHNDVGSYTVVLDGMEMCGDPGGEVYTKRTFSSRRYESKMLSSYGHPVPVVGGKLQKTGRAAAAKVLRAEFSDAQDVIALDLTAAYSVPSLRSLVRTLTFDRENATVTVADAAAFSEPTAFEVPVVTYRAYARDKDPGRFALRRTAGKRRGHDMTVDVKASAPVDFRDEKITNPGRADVTRLGFAFHEPVTNATFTVVYAAGAEARLRRRPWSERRKR